MNDLDEDYWSERYQEGQTGWDIGYASPQLIDFATTFPKDARILIPGAGNAYEAEAFMEDGLCKCLRCRPHNRAASGLAKPCS